MYQDLTGIKIKGGRFGDSDWVELDGILTSRLNIMYGGNGCGKTSISRAFQEYRDGASSKTHDFPLQLMSSTPLPQDHEKGIFVFNEDFLYNQVKFRKHGMETIVMFGKQKEYDDQIQEVEAKKKAEEKEVNKYQGIVGDLDETSQFCDHTKQHPDSIQSLEHKIITTLDGDTSYAGRNKEITGNKNKTHVKVDIFEKLKDVDANPSAQNVPAELIGKSNGEILEYIHSNTERLRQTLNKDELHWVARPITSNLDIDGIKSLLNSSVESNELSDREKRLLALLQDNSEGPLVIRGAQEHIIDKHASICPLCHQSITEEHRVNMVETLSHLLNEEAKKHKKAIEDTINLIQDISIIYPCFPDGYKAEEIRACESACLALNNFHAKARKVMNAKLSNLYAVSPDIDLIDGAEYSRLSNELQTAYKSVSDGVVAYNTDIKAAKNLKSKVLGANLYLSYLEIKPMLDLLEEKKSSLHDNLREANTHQQNVTSFENDIRNLESLKKNTGIAVDFINECFKRVFLNDKRMELKDEGKGEYVIYSNGKKVTPDRVSSGERNIIGLSYFFAMLGANNTLGKLYEHPMLIVIDDPISSNDTGNRSGILSLLKDKFYDIFNRITEIEGKNRTVKYYGSKILVLSHEMKTVKALKGIGSDYIQHGQSGSYFELRDNSVLKVSGLITSEYMQHMKRIFAFANSPEADAGDAMVIGNEMRRVFETYSSFVYNTGIEEMLQKRRNYRGSHGDDNFNRFSKLAATVVFNSTSHSNALTDDMAPDEELYSPNELKRIAKEMLAFIFATNPTHLISYFESEEVDVIREWCIS